MKLDCYSVLGVSPAAEDVVIRAAYLALMRRYHPDRDASAEAAARARAITEAYEAIGDPASRAEYDTRRAAYQFAIPAFAPGPPPRRGGDAPFIGAIAALALSVLAAVIWLPIGEGEPPGMARPVPRATADPPPKVAVSEPPAALPSPLAQTGQRPPDTVLERIEDEPQLPDLAELTAPPEKAEPARPKLAQATAEASPRSAARRTAPPKHAAKADNGKLAAIERQSTLFYSQSVIHADDSKRSQLQQARNLFVAARSGCRSDSCVTDAHLAHIREVARIMEAREQTTP